jgi:hypothetical protein
MISMTGPAFAGAWLRDTGAKFFSYGATLRKSGGYLRPEYSFYGEFGISPYLTLGLGFNESGGQSGHVLVFARFPVAHSWQNTKVAVELGLGGNHYLGKWDGMVKSTLSVGRGFSSRWGNGWINVDTGLELRRPANRPALKLDATIGLSEGMRFRPMLQIETTYITGKPLIWAVIPSVMIDGRNNQTWVVGIERKTTGQPTLGLRFGLWRKF